MMTVSPRQNRCRDGRGFSLVEAVLSLVIVSVMLVAALNTVGASRLSQSTIAKYGRGQLLAEDLMVEILRQDYEDPDGSPVFGSESGESTLVRSDFDDVDDYHGWSSSPPTDRSGSLISGWDGWQRSVTVVWADVMSPGQTAPSETGAKRISVTVTYGAVPVASLVAIRTASGVWETAP